jgi:hypothetical protein
MGVPVVDTGPMGAMTVLVAKIFCFLVVLLTLLAGDSSAAKAADDCRYFNGGVSRLEWTQGSTPRGARLIFDDRWQEAYSFHGQWLAYEGPPADSRISGWLNLGLPFFMDVKRGEKVKADLGIQDASRLEAALHPGMIELVLGARMMWDQLGWFAVTQPQPVTAVGVEGLTRTFSALVGDRLVYGMAIAVEFGCFALFGMFSAEDGRQLFVDDLGFLNSTIRVEWYEPPPPPPPSPPVPYARLLPESTSVLETLQGADLLPESPSVLEILRGVGPPAVDPRR